MANKRLIGSRLAGIAPGSRLPITAPRDGRGFSLLELVVVIVLIAFLMVIAIARLLAIYADAERVAMETVAGTLRSALGMKVAESIVRQDFRDLQAMDGSNPMERLAELPANYLGALADPDVASLENGNWFFDATRRELVYLVRNKTHFSGGAANPPRARFAVRVSYVDRNGNGRFDSGVESVEGLRLSPVEQYAWTR